MDTTNTSGKVATDPRITKNPDGSVTLALCFPINVAGEEVSAITLKRPKAKTLMAMDDYAGSVAKGIALIAACAGIPFAAATEIDGDDYGLASDVASGFLPNVLKAGATRSPTSPTS